MRLDYHVEHMHETRNAYRILVVNSDEKGQLGRPIHKMIR
jgi:hypothetical protein